MSNLQSFELDQLADEARVTKLDQIVRLKDDFSLTQLTLAGRDLQTVLEARDLLLRLNIGCEEPAFRWVSPPLIMQGSAEIDCFLNVNATQVAQKKRRIGFIK